MSQELDERLNRALAERDRLSALSQKIQGRKEAAAKALEELRGEIRSKNLDPDNLEDTIEKLEKAYADGVAQLESEVATAKNEISPYLEKMK